MTHTDNAPLKSKRITPLHKLLAVAVLLGGGAGILELHSFPDKPNFHHGRILALGLYFFVFVCATKMALRYPRNLKVGAALLAIISACLFVFGLISEIS